MTAVATSGSSAPPPPVARLSAADIASELGQHAPTPEQTAVIEAPLAPLEKELLEMCAEDNHMEDYVLQPEDVQQQGRSRSASRRR